VEIKTNFFESARNTSIEFVPAKDRRTLHFRDEKHLHARNAFVFMSQASRKRLSPDSKALRETFCVTLFPQNKFPGVSGRIRASKEPKSYMRRLTERTTKRALEIQEIIEKRREAELVGCTFAPKINAGLIKCAACS
jgi:hypothetical protein